MKSIFDEKICLANPAPFFFDRESQIHNRQCCFYVDFDMICPKRDEMLKKFATYLRNSLPDGLHLYVDDYEVSICDWYDNTVIDSYGDVVLEITGVSAVINAIAGAGRALANDREAFCSNCSLEKDE